MTAIRKLRCAVYTRKSSEEGLDQEFNSLDAQRDACSAYIASQIGSGWLLVPTHYDDGGISGGTMERPALHRLLDDIRSKRIDVVVVYKIDRLTRSLTDFAKIVEVFDSSSVSFVSVTQQFNTTTSMGRLTLNVLLSFAQFEREVTAERIRDKIAASKAKGMWMGGHVPLGYQVVDRKLIAKEPEASFVRSLFARYLQLKSVPALATAVTREAIAAERCAIGNAGDEEPVLPDASKFTRKSGAGMLYRLLANPIYIGRVKHRDQVHDGEHQGIVDPGVFEAVQASLASNAVIPLGTSKRPSSQVEGHLLTGLLYDDSGDPMKPSHSNAHGKRYRYYISRRLSLAKREDPSAWRVPAPELDQATLRFARDLLADRTRLSEWIRADQSSRNIHAGLKMADDLREQIGASKPARHRQIIDRRTIVAKIFRRITLKSEAIIFNVDVKAIIDMLFNNAVMDTNSDQFDDCDQHLVAMQLPMTIKRRGREMRLVIPSARASRQPDAALVSLVAKAHLYLQRLNDGPNKQIAEVAEEFGEHRADVSRILPIAFIAPKLLEQILTGAQPAERSARFLSRAELPLLWSDQIEAIG